MATPPHIRFSIRGRFDGTPEQWSYGFHYDVARVDSGPATIQDFDMSTVASAINAFHSHARFPAKVVVEEWRGYTIGSNGRMQGNPVLGSWSVATQPKGLGAGNLGWPPQCSVAITYEATNRGAARFGRSYLPQPYFALGADGRLAGTDCTALLTAFKTMLKAIGDSPPGPLAQALVNISPGATSAAPGTLQNVITLKCGRVVDTIRSRRTKMDEDRQALSY